MFHVTNGKINFESLRKPMRFRNIKRIYRNFRKRYYTLFIVARLLVPIALTILALFAVTAVLLLMSTLRPGNTADGVQPERYYLPAQTIEWTGAQGNKLSGWLIVRDKRNPLIFLCHGYGKDSNRGRLLPLAKRMLENGYNVFMFNFRGHGGSEYSICSLGYKEAEDLRLAVETAVRDKWTDSPQIGIFGVSMGGYAAMVVAKNNPTIKAIAVDSPFISVNTFLNDRIVTLLGMRFGPITGLANLFYDIYFYNAPKQPPIMPNDLSEKAVLFLLPPLSLAGVDEARRIAASLNCRKSVEEVPTPRDGLIYGDEIQLYDETVVRFFRTELPITTFSAESAPR